MKENGLLPDYIAVIVTQIRQSENTFPKDRNPIVNDRDSLVVVVDIR